MENMNAFSSGFPLEHLPELTEEVFFAFHSGIQKMLYLNPAFDEIWSISRNDVLSDLSLLTNSVHPDDKDFVAASFSDLQKKQQHIEFRIQLGGGSIKWIKLNAYISKSDREIIVGTAADISGLKDYAHVLHKFTEKKNSILEILSHDLLGPLGNIKMAMTLLNSYPEISSNEEIMRLMNIVSNSCQRGVSMIHDLTNKEFLQTSEAKIVKERVDLVEKIKEMVAQLMQSPREGHQRFRFESSAQSVFAAVDVSKFMQVLTNLISNALKFTPDMGNISITLTDQDKDILITVRDTGVGIPKDLQPYLFEKFTRAGRPGIKGEPSIGLGMSITKTIIDWHNGQIWFESEENKGTTFYIKIPKYS